MQMEITDACAFAAESGQCAALCFLDLFTFVMTPRLCIIEDTRTPIPDGFRLVWVHREAYDTWRVSPLATFIDGSARTTMPGIPATRPQWVFDGDTCPESFHRVFVRLHVDEDSYSEWRLCPSVGFIEISFGQPAAVAAAAPVGSPSIPSYEVLVVADTDTEDEDSLDVQPKRPMLEHRDDTSNASLPPSPSNSATRASDAFTAAVADDAVTPKVPARRGRPPKRHIDKVRDSGPAATVAENAHIDISAELENVPIVHEFIQHMKLARAKRNAEWGTRMEQLVTQQQFPVTEECRGIWRVCQEEINLRRLVVKRAERANTASEKHTILDANPFHHIDKLIARLLFTAEPDEK